MVQTGDISYRLFNLSLLLFSLVIQRIDQVDPENVTFAAFSGWFAVLLLRIEVCISVFQLVAEVLMWMRASPPDWLRAVNRHVWLGERVLLAGALLAICVAFVFAPASAGDLTMLSSKGHADGNLDRILPQFTETPPCLVNYDPEHWPPVEPFARSNAVRIELKPDESNPQATFYVIASSVSVGILLFAIGVALVVVPKIVAALDRQRPGCVAFLASLPTATRHAYYYDEIDGARWAFAPNPAWLEIHSSLAQRTIGGAFERCDDAQAEALIAAKDPATILPGTVLEISARRPWPHGKMAALGGPYWAVFWNDRGERSIYFNTGGGYRVRVDQVRSIPAAPRRRSARLAEKGE